MYRLHLSITFVAVVSLLIGGLSLTSQAAFSSDALDAALVAAVRHGNLATARRLLDRGTNPNAREMVIPKPTAADPPTGVTPYKGDTVLMLAVRTGSMRLVKLLLRRGANLNGRGEAGFTPLIEAVRTYHADLVKLLLARGAKPNQQNDNGDTALIFAANDGQTALAAALLARGADINGGTGWTPLMDAAYNGFADTVKFLLNKDARVNLRRNGMTALECAEIQGNEEVADLLRRAGGQGRSREVLEKLSEQDSKEFDAQRRANAQRWSQERILTDQDQQVLEVVLLDVLADRRKDLTEMAWKPTTIVLLNKTALGPGLTDDGQMNSELDTGHTNDITTEMRQDIQRRNGEPISLSDFKPLSTRILIRDMDTKQAWEHIFYKQYPDARCWVETFLPGYSKAGDKAIVRFWIGPTPHGAAGTYFLRRQQGVWRVKWHHFAFFV